MEHRNRTNNTTGWSWSASKITERPSCSFGKPIVKVVVLLSLALFSFLGSALGGSTEEMGNRKRSSIISHRNNNKRILPQGSCITTGTIKDDMMDCIREAIDGQRPRSPAETDFEHMQFGPGTMPSDATYSNETIQKFKDCHIRWALRQVETTTFGHQSPSLDMICCGGIDMPSRDSAAPTTEPTQQPHVRKRPKKFRKGKKEGNKKDKKQTNRLLSAEKAEGYCEEETIIGYLCGPCKEIPLGYCQRAQTEAPITSPTGRPSDQPRASEDQIFL